MNKEEWTNQFLDLFDKAEKELGHKQALASLGDMVKLLDLTTAGNLIKNDCDPYLTINSFEDNMYDEGNENAGFIHLNAILKSVEEIINCSEDGYYSEFEFQEFVRNENEDEIKLREVENLDTSINWIVEDDRVNVPIKELQIQFELKQN